MTRKVGLAFKRHGAVIPLVNILPLRRIAPGIRSTEKYKRITASLQELGLIEPLMIFPQKGQKGRYLLLDGNIRLDIMKGLGMTEACCLFATDDESYTYNHKVNQLSPIQEHFMIMKAIESGVSEDRIAITLNVDVAGIRRKMSLLDGICPEAVALLKDRKASASALREVRRVAPMRQIEMAELMIATNNFSASYAKCLYAATPDDQRLEGEEPTDNHGISPEDRTRMEGEMEGLRRNFKVLEETHGENVLRLVLAIGYLKKLLENARVVRYLSKHYPEILAEFQRVLEAPDLEITPAPSGEQG